MRQNLRQLTCKVLGHEVYDAETLRAQPWTWGVFRGYGAAAFAHKNCLRCGVQVGALEADKIGARKAA